MIIPVTTIGQESDELTFKDLKKVNCKGVNEKSSQKKQERCLLVDVVQDSINYFPRMTRNCDSPVSTPEEAWEELRKLYPGYQDNQLHCWTEYSGYFCFSLGCDGL